MEAKHTPGPWEIWCGNDDDGYEISVYREADDTVQEICRVEGWVDEVKANARLIVAAPELLDACELAFWTATNPPTNEGWENMIDVLRAAIAKAKGEE